MCKIKLLSYKNVNAQSEDDKYGKLMPRFLTTVYIFFFAKYCYQNLRLLSNLPHFLFFDAVGFSRHLSPQIQTTLTHRLHSQVLIKES